MKPILNAAVVVALVAAAPAVAAPTPGTHLLESYVSIQRALAGDTLEGVKAAAGHVAHGAGQLKAKGPVAFQRVAAAGKAVGAAKDLAAARTAFKELSAAVLAVADSGLLGKHSLVAIHCPMAEASWLQEGAAVRNPYYGKSMLTCGTPRSNAAPR